MNQIESMQSLRVSSLLFFFFLACVVFVVSPALAKKTSATTHPVSRKSHNAQKVKRSVQLVHLLQLIRSANPNTRIAAMQKLAKYHGKDQVLFAALARRMFDPIQSVRFLAATQLVRWGTSSLSVLRSALGHRSKKIRWSATYTLFLLPKTKSIRSILVLLLRDHYYHVRMHAILGLTQPTISDAEWLAIRDLLKREIHPINRMRCLDALLPKKKKVFGILTHEMFTDPHPLVRRYAARLLVRQGFPVQKVQKALLKGLKEEKDEVIQLAFLHLWEALVAKEPKVRMTSVFPLLPSLLNARLWTLRVAAIRDVGQLKPKVAVEFLPNVRKMQKDPVLEVRTAAKKLFLKLQTSLGKLAK